MPKKTTAKTKAKKAKSNKVEATAMPSFHETPSVNVKKVNNGYVLSRYTSKGDRTLIAKDEKEMQRFTNQLLKEK
jgi:hypothetical protein